MPANEPRKSKAERREAARKEAERLAAKQKATESRNRLVIVVASVLVIALIGVAGFFIWKESQRTLLTDFEGEVPANSTLTGGIVFGAGAVPGEAVEGAPVVDAYIDFMCPHCGTFEEVNGDDLRTLLEGSEATVIVHPLNFLDGASTEGDYSTRASAAFALVASEAPEAAYQFMQDLFAQQPAENGPGLTADVIAQIAVDAGVPQEVADTLDSGFYADWVAVASNQAREDLTRASTPTILLNGDQWTGDWATPGALLQAVQDAA